MVPKPGLEPGQAVPITPQDKKRQYKIHGEIRKNVLQK
jgi:hypothetical protein